MNGKARVVKLEDVSDVSLQCRDLRHSWRVRTDYSLEKLLDGGRGTTRLLVCSRCKAERLDTYLLPSFRLVQSRTTYPEGYLLRGREPGTPPGPRRIADVRRESFARAEVRRAATADVDGVVPVSGTKKRTPSRRRLASV